MLGIFTKCQTRFVYYNLQANKKYYFNYNFLVHMYNCMYMMGSNRIETGNVFSKACIKAYSIDEWTFQVKHEHVSSSIPI